MIVTQFCLKDSASGGRKSPLCLRSQRPRHFFAILPYLPIPSPSRHYLPHPECSEIEENSKKRHDHKQDKAPSTAMPLLVSYYPRHWTARSLVAAPGGTNGRITRLRITWLRITYSETCLSQQAVLSQSRGLLL